MCFLSVIVIFVFVNCAACDLSRNGKQTSVFETKDVIIETIDKPEKTHVFDNFRSITVILTAPISNTLKPQDLNANFEIRLEKVQEYMEKQYGIIVRFDVFDLKQYKVEADVRLSSGYDTDVYMVENKEFFYFENTVDNVVLNYDVAADLTDYVGQYYPEVEVMIEQNPELKSVLYRDDRLYAIPGCTGMPMDLYGLVINKNVYDLPSKDQSLSTNDVVEIYKKIGELRPDYYGVCNFRSFLNIAQKDYSEVLNGFTVIEQSLPILLEDSFDFKDMFSMYNDIYNSSSNIQHEAFKLWRGSWIDASNFSKLTMDDYVSLNAAPVVELINYSTFRDSVSGIANSDKFNESYYVIPIRYNRNQPKLTYAPKFYISTYSDEIEASLTFLRCLEYDQTVYDLLRYGVKDTDFYETENGIHLNTFYFTKSILSPHFDKKLGHDFSLWHEFYSDYLISQTEKRSEEDLYRMDVKNAISNIQKDDERFNDIIIHRNKIYGKEVYKILNTDSFNDRKMNDFLNLFDRNDNEYLIKEITFYLHDQ